jgi:hypothetical protein
VHERIESEQEEEKISSRILSLENREVVFG